MSENQRKHPEHDVAERLASQLFFANKEEAQASADREVDLHDRHHAIRSARAALQEAERMEQEAATLHLSRSNAETDAQRADIDRRVQEMREWALIQLETAHRKTAEALAITPEGLQPGVNELKDRLNPQKRKA